MNTIQNWLAYSLDFQEGIDLLMQVDPKNRFLGGFLQKGKNEYNQGKLISELRRLQFSVGPAQTGNHDRKIQKRDPEKPQETAVKAGHKPQADAASGQNDGPNIYPSAIREAIQRRSAAANARDRKANELSTLHSNAERKQARAEIEQLHSEVKRWQDIIKGWERTQEAPDQLPDVAAEVRAKPKPAAARKKGPTSLHQQLLNARANLSKKRGMLKRWENDQDQDPFKRQARIDKYKTAISSWESKIEELEKKIQDGSATEKET